MYNPNTQDAGIRTAQGLIQRLWSGDLYPCCGEVVLQEEQLAGGYWEQRRVGVGDVVEHQGFNGLRFKEEDIYVDDRVHSMCK